MIAYVNFVPGTWLSGWDTLHPEFNFPLYFKRVFFGVWQEHQGLGAMASQAHPAEISRVAILWFLSLFLHTNAVRYVFFSLTFLVGGIGMYFFALETIPQKSKQAAFLGALFYLLNLAVVQQFYVPLEMFAVHFATLPLLMLFAYKYIDKGRIKDVILFSITNIFAASMAHTSTLFYVYFLSFVLFLISFSLLKRRKNVFKRIALLIILTVTLNLYWMAPNLLFLLKHGKEVSASWIHTNFSDEAFLQSKAFGTIDDLAHSRNFLFNWRDFSFSERKFVDLMSVWKSHLNDPGIWELGTALFAFSIIGLFFALLSGSEVGISLLPVFVLSVFFLINQNPPFEGVFGFLRDNFSLFKEGFRFPFTKFSILWEFTLAFYFSAFFSYLLPKLRIVKWLTVFAVGTGLIIYMLPVFKGELINPNMKVSIPNAYFEMFSWFETRPDGRVLMLPVQTAWGWQYRDWGYQGAGFTWFGISQPTLNREFDRWNVYNENFYREISFAVYSQNQKLFENILTKYNVSYLLLDESITNVGGNDKELYIGEIKDMIANTPRAKELAKFDFMTVFGVQSDKGISYISVPKYYSKLKVNDNYASYDYFYTQLDDYVYDDSAISFPFSDLGWRSHLQVTEDKNNATIFDSVTGASVKISLSQAINESFGEGRGQKDAYNCDLNKAGGVEKKLLENGVFYKAWDGGVSCDFFVYPDLNYKQQYLLRVKGENKSGRSLKVYLYNWKTHRMDLEEVLPNGTFDKWFFVRPTAFEGKGYTLNIETRSYGRIESKNVLEKIEFVPVSMDWLSSIHEGEVASTENDAKILSVNKINPVLYELRASGDGLVVLNQAYESGWLAFSIQDFKIFSHIKFDGWANGFFVDGEDSTIYIFYWPQLLEWGGLVLLPLTFGLLLLKSRNSPRLLPSKI